MRFVPINIQTVLTTQSLLPLSQFLPIADAVYDLTFRITNEENSTRPVFAVNSHKPSTSSHLNKQSTINIGLTPFRQNQCQLICRSHTFYGKMARSCKPWCQWPGPKPRRLEPSSRQASRPQSPVEQENDHNTR